MEQCKCSFCDGFYDADILIKCGDRVICSTCVEETKQLMAKDVTMTDGINAKYRRPYSKPAHFGKTVIILSPINDPDESYPTTA